MATRKATQTNAGAPTCQQLEGFHIPADYTVRRTGSDASSSETRPGPLLRRTTSGSEDYGERIYPYPAVHPRAAGAGPVSWWPSNWRRIPEYSPVNYELDSSERPIGDNAIFSALLFVTLGGCGLISVYASLWRNTFGRINDTVFRYKVGGEF